MKTQLLCHLLHEAFLIFLWHHYPENTYKECMAQTRGFLNSREQWFLNGSGIMVWGPPGDTELVTSVTDFYSCVVWRLRADRSQTDCLGSTPYTGQPITSCVTYKALKTKQKPPFACFPLCKMVLLIEHTSQGVLWGSVS